MAAPATVGVILLLGIAAQANAAGRVQDVPRDWSCAGLRRLGIAAVSASSSLGEGDQYAPARAIDGNRGSKWVATHQPSPAQPQWITLTLFGSQDVTGVAVFGEAIGNDGIQDAQVQVAGRVATEFTTVAGVEAAQSPSWLATFDPVKTSAVRLLVTRSGGPSTHTDVFEIEVFGRPLAAAELNDETTGTWDATWLDREHAAVRGVRFAVEAGGRDLAEQPAQAEAAAFTDPIGSGVELRQRWGADVQVERRIRVYLHVPDGFHPRSPRLSAAGKNVWVQDVQFHTDSIDWVIEFECVGKQ
jgi:hypothetical protein